MKPTAAQFDDPLDFGRPIHVVIVEGNDNRFEDLKAIADQVDALTLKLTRVRSSDEVIDLVEQGVVDHCLAPVDGASELARRLLETSHVVPVTGLLSPHESGDKPDLMVGIVQEGALVVIARERLTPSLLAQTLLSAEARRRFGTSAFQHRRLLDSLLDETEIVVALLDDEGRILRLNWAAELVTGVDAGEAIGQPFSTLFGSDPSDDVQTQISEALSGLTPIRFRHSWTSPAGRVKEVAWSVVMLPDLRTPGSTSDVTRPRLLCTGQDLSEEAGARLSASVSAQLLDFMADSMPVILLAIDQDGVVLLSQGRGWLDLDEDGSIAVGESMFDRYAGSPEVVRNVRRVLKGDTVDSYVDFQDRSYRVRYLPRWSDDHVAGALIAALDVTSERESASWATGLAAALDLTEEPICVIGVDGSIRHANAALTSAMGYSLSAVQALPGPVAFFKSRREAAEVFRSVREGAQWEGSATLVNKAGEEVFAYLTSRPARDADGRVVGFVCAMRLVGQDVVAG